MVTYQNIIFDKKKLEKSTPIYFNKLTFINIIDIPKCLALHSEKADKTGGVITAEDESGSSGYPSDIKRISTLY